MQFNYEDFLYEQMEKGETFSSLEMLKVRNLKIPNPLTPQKEDYCKLIPCMVEANCSNSTPIKAVS